MLMLHLIVKILRAFNQPFTAINIKCVSSKEIEDITKSLKIKIHMDTMQYQQKF